MGGTFDRSEAKVVGVRWGQAKVWRVRTHKLRDPFGLASLEGATRLRQSLRAACLRAG